MSFSAYIELMSAAPTWESPTEFAVLTAVANFQNDKWGGWAYPRIATIAIHHDVRRGRGHDHNRCLLTSVGQRRQEPALARRLAHPQPLIAQIQLMKFQLHGPSVRRG